MPENFFLLLPLIGGYIFANQWNQTKWYAARWEKERLLLNSALWGMVFLALAVCIIYLQDLLTCVSWLPCLPRWPLHMGEFHYLGAALLALFFGAVAWMPANQIWQKREDKIIQTEGTLLDILTHSSMKQRKTVLLTMKNSKVYAGFITSAPSPGDSHPMIRILPTTSGYRDRKTHRVVFTTNYSEALEKISGDCNAMQAELEHRQQRASELAEQLKQGFDRDKIEESKRLTSEGDLIYNELTTLAASVEDFGILIPVEEIASMTLYHAAIHAKYFAPLSRINAKKNA